MLIQEIKKIESSKKKLREFGYVMAAFFGILATVSFFKHRPHAFYWAGTAGVFLFLGILIPQILKPVQKIWMTLALLIGWVMARVILGVLFYLVVTPIGLLMRLSGKDLLHLKLEPDKKSYWLPKEPQTDKESY